MLSDMPEEETFDALSDFYKVMADPTRCKLIFALRDREMGIATRPNAMWKRSTTAALTTIIIDRFMLIRLDK